MKEQAYPRPESGVSALDANRLNHAEMMRLFPELFERNRMLPVAHYPRVLPKISRFAVPPGVGGSAFLPSPNEFRFPCPLRRGSEGTASPTR